MEIDEKDLLQADATIIAGVLILLSLLSAGNSIPSAIGLVRPQPEDVTHALGLMARVLIGVAIIPFIIAVGYLLSDSGKKFSAAKRSTRLGLGYLAIATMMVLMIGTG